MQFGHPHDWGLYSSLSSVTILGAIANRQFATLGYETTTAALMVVGGVSLLSANALRFSYDGLDMRMGSVLSKTLHPSVMLRARALYLSTGLLASGHHWFLGWRVPTILSLWNLTVGLIWLITGQVCYRGGLSAARAVLTASTSVAFAAVLGLWLRDGISLFMGWVNLSGERLEVVNDGETVFGEEPDVPPDASRAKDDEEDGRLRPLKRWRCFKTHGGTDYFFDPANEMIHYLGATGSGNYAVDPRRNHTFVYETYEGLAAQIAQLERERGASAVEAEAIAARSAAPEQAAGRSAGVKIRSKLLAPPAEMAVEQQV